MSPASILIVEDEVIIAENLSNKIRKLGYAVAGIAHSGNGAIKMAFDLRPQLILMDIQLEGTVDGIDTAEAIRNRYDVPIVYLTAHSDRATLQRAKLSEPLGYILKPFDDRDLTIKIEMALYKHKTDKKIQDQRELLRITLSSIGEAVIATDAEGRISFINTVAESLTGQLKDTTIGKPLEQALTIIDENDQTRLTNLMQNLLNMGKISNPTSRWLLDRGEKAVPIRINGSPIRDKLGNFRGIIIICRDISQQRRSEKEKDELLSKLENALGKVRLLSGLLPICASCKRIRDDKGYWNQIESYIKSHSEVEFSHGICPRCVKELYPDYYDRGQHK